MKRREKKLVYQHKNGNFHIQFWYAENTKHFNKRACNPDDTRQTADTEVKANYYAMKWLEIVESGGDPLKMLADAKARREANAERPRTILELVEKVRPIAQQFWRTPEKYPLPGLKKLADAHGSKQLWAVTREFAKSFREQLIKEGLSANTVNRYCEGYQGLWTIAQSDGRDWVSGQPWKVDKLPVPQPEKYVLSRSDELKLLLKAVDLDGMPAQDEAEALQNIATLLTERKPSKRAKNGLPPRLYSHAAAALVCMIEGGMRPGEFTLLPLSSVNLLATQPFLTIASYKTGAQRAVKTRTVPITARALPIYQALVRSSKNGRLYPYETFDVALESLCEKAGVRRHTPHELRHTFWQRMRELNVQETIIEQIVGSKRRDDYGRLNVEYAAEVMSQLSKPARVYHGNVVEFLSKRNAA